MGEDEEQTLAALKQSRATIDPLVIAHHGRIFGRAGDSFIAEFASPVDAVRCAMEIQSMLEKFNLDRSDSNRFSFRIGINLGDVIDDDNDLIGDSVNIAARLESLADPGGISISRTVLDHTVDKLKFAFEYQGEKKVKNITNPIEAYRILLNGVDNGYQGRAGRSRNRQLRPAMILGAVAAAIIGIGIYWQHYSGIGEHQTLPVEVLPAEVKPAIVILPFANMSADPEQEYFVDGITADLITDLSKISGLIVTARNSSFVYKGRAVDVNEIAKKLGARYVLEGSVRRINDQLRINTLLIDTQNGEQLWSDRFDETLGDIFEMQDKITQTVVSKLAVTLTDAEEKLVRHADTSNAQAYEAFLRGWEHFRRFTPQDFKAAQHYLEKAVQRDPEFGRANAALALLYQQAAELAWAKSLGMGEHKAKMLSGRYLAAAWKNPTSLAHRVAMEIFLPANQTEKAYEHVLKVLSIDANDPANHAAAAKTLIYLGRPVDAVSHIERAMDLEIFFPAEYLYLRGMARFGLEQYPQAIEDLYEAIKRNPNQYQYWVPLGASLAHTGRTDEAKTAIENFRSDKNAGIHFGRWTESNILHIWPYRYEEDWLRLKTGLNLAADTPLAPQSGGPLYRYKLERKPEVPTNDQ